MSFGRVVESKEADALPLQTLWLCRIAGLQRMPIKPAKQSPTWQYRRRSKVELLKLLPKISRSNTPVAASACLPSAET